MTLLLFTNITLVLGALIGMYCIAHHLKRGFIVFLGVEASMAYIGYYTSNYGLIVAAALYFVMNVYSYHKWTQADNARRAASKMSEEELEAESWKITGEVGKSRRHGR